MKKKLTHQAPPAPKAKVAELSDNASFSQIVKFFNDNQKATVFFKAGGKIDKLVETNAVRWRLLLNEVDMHGTMGGINLSALGRELTKDEYIIILTQFCASVAGHDYSLTADGDYDGDGNFFQNAYHLLRKESKGYLACHSKKIGSTKHSVEPAKVEQKPELEVCVGLVGGQICCSKLPEGVKLTIW